MKKLMSIIISILFALSLTGLCFAQAAPPTPKPEDLKKTEEMQPAWEKTASEKNDLKKKAMEEQEKAKGAAPTGAIPGGGPPPVPPTK